jgi:sorbitol/mannitol transport system permease protein
MMYRAYIKRAKHYSVNIFSVVLALFYTFPIIYMILSSFKKEEKVVEWGFSFAPTLQNYRDVINPSLNLYIFNSITVTVLTVLVSAILSVLVAYVLVFGTLKKPDDVYFWFVSTTLLPAVGVIIPVYLFFQAARLSDTKLGLVLLYCGTGIPLMIWMMTSFFKEVPREMIEAADIDGSPRFNTFIHIILPMVRNGILSSALLVFVTVWNEFFFAVTTTYTKSPTLPIYLAKYMTQQGFFWGKMCAISTIAVIIPIVIGIATQKTFARGLTMGAVKE